MLDLYVVGFATDLGSEYAVVVDVGRHPYRLREPGGGVAFAPRFREPKLVERRWIARCEPQESLAHAVLLSPDDRPLGLIEYVRKNIPSSAESAKRAQRLRAAREEALSESWCSAVFVLGRLRALEWNVVAVSLLPLHEDFGVLKPLALHHVPVVSNDGIDAGGHGIEIWLPAGAADIVKDCLRLGVSHAGAGIVGGVDLTDLGVPLLGVARIEILVQLLAADALLGLGLDDRAEPLVLGVLESLAGLAWVEARSKVGVETLRRGCVVCQLGGALEPR
jgi:hypothetical protein